MPPEQPQQGYWVNLVVAESTVSYALYTTNSANLSCESNAASHQSSAAERGPIGATRSQLQLATVAVGVLGLVALA